MSLSVKPEDGEAVLFGKAVNELQSDMVVADDEVTGTLKYVNGYVDFSSNTSEQSGNYLALKNKDTQSIKVTTTHNEESITKIYGLSGLTLETE